MSSLRLIGETLAVGWSVIIRRQFNLKFSVSADIETMSGENIVILYEDVFDVLLFGWAEGGVGPVEMVKNFFLDSSLSFGFSCSSCLSSASSSKIRCCMGVYVVGSPGCSGVGNQYVSCSSDDWFVFISWLRYRSVFSMCWCIMKVRVDGSTGLMCLICSGVNTRKSAMCVSTGRV